MPSGQVNARLEPILSVVLHGPTGVTRTVAAVVDTGFGGELALPVSMIRILALPLSGRVAGVLATGTIILFDTYTADVDWDGATRAITVQAADGPPLLGTDLLAGCDVAIRMTVGGAVTISASP